MENQQSKSRVTKSKQPHKKKKQKSKSWFKRILIWLSSLFVISIIIGLITVFIMISNAPKITEADLVGTIPATIYDKNDNVVYKLGGNDRVLIEPTAIPKNIEDAVLSIEDRRFYDHSGFDIIRIGGSLVSNLTRGGLQGGSTITQQLVKLSAFSTAKKDQTITRKVQEIWLATQLENQYTKKDILALYLNKAFLANNTYGFGTAARYYYNKTPEQLTIAQAALFAGIVQAPSAYDPIYNPERATARRNIVLKAMLDNNKITQTQYEEALHTDIADGMVDRKSQKSTNELALDAYIQVVMEEIKEITDTDPYTQGLEIYTTLDYKAQMQLTNLLDTNQAINWPNQTIQAAVTITDPKTGAIVAMSGGRNTSVLLGHNRATSANRSVGSTAKPLIDYGPAIEYLNYPTAHIVSDAPIKYTGGPELKNIDNRYRGNMTLRQALVQSRNTPALRVFKDVGVTNARAFLAKNGIVKDVLNESNSIGFEASTLQMSAAYGAFANGGIYYKPFTIRKVTTRSGETALYTAEGTRSMSDFTAYMITDILKDIPGNTAQYANISNLKHAGKTGSTNYTEEQYKVVTQNRNVDYAAMDVWYVGYTPNYVISSWVGYDKPLQPGNFIRIQDYRIPQLIYKNMMTYLNGQSRSDWTMPNSVTKVGSELYVKDSKLIPVKRIETTTRPLETTTEQSTSDTSSDESSAINPDEYSETSQTEKETTKATTTAKTTTKVTTTTQKETTTTKRP